MRSLANIATMAAIFTAASTSALKVQGYKKGDELKGWGGTKPYDAGCEKYNDWRECE